jgi:hypothetical protein
MPLNPLLRRVIKKIKNLFRPEDPHEYALVGAPIRPKPPTLRAKAAAIPDSGRDGIITPGVSQGIRVPKN